MIHRFDDTTTQPLLGRRRGPDGRYHDADQLDDMEDLREAFAHERHRNSSVAPIIFALIFLTLVVVALALAVHLPGVRE